MTPETANRLQRWVTRYPNAVGGPASEAEVAAAERRLNASLPPDFREFLLRYCTALVEGYSIYGLRPEELIMGPQQMLVEQTSLHRNTWLPPHLKGMVAISADSAGNPIGFLPDDVRVHVWDHDTGEILVLAESFDAWLGKILA